mgnify:CR=1 FL=1
MLWRAYHLGGGGRRGIDTVSPNEWPLRWELSVHVQSAVARVKNGALARALIEVRRRYLLRGGVGRQAGRGGQAGTLLTDPTPHRGQSGETFWRNPALKFPEFSLNRVVGSLQES